MDTRFVVVGGGIVGLAVGARLASIGSTLVLEKHTHPIQETSSRNSGVVHAGMYYPADSLKTKLCMQGNANMWRMAERYGDVLDARRIGKWIGAVNDEEDQVLQQLGKNMEARGIPYRWVPQEEAKALEPHLAMTSILESPNTGIVEQHSYANLLQHFIENATTDSQVVTGCQVSGVKYTNHTSSSSSVKIEVHTEDGSTIQCATVVNAMGLHANDFFSKLLRLNTGEGSSSSTALQPPPDERQYFCKGRYLGCKKKLLSRLVYPCPLPNLKGLGVHSVVDTGGALRFGPDAVYVESREDLSVEAEQDALLDSSYEAIKRYIPSIQKDDLFVDFAGMRPKLSGPGEPFRDFIIREGVALKGDVGVLVPLPGVVSLAGIESPGLTAATAIADYVVDEVLRLSSDAPPAPWAA